MYRNFITDFFCKMIKTVNLKTLSERIPVFFSFLTFPQDTVVPQGCPGCLTLQFDIQKLPHKL